MTNDSSDAMHDEARTRAAHTVAMLRTRLRAVYAGRRFLHFGGPLAGLVTQMKALQALGAERPFLLGESPGTGPQPTAEQCESLHLGIISRAGDIVEAMRASQRALRNLPAEVQAAVDRWDPDREARAAAWISLEATEDVAGRPVFGGRRTEWAPLEDKTQVDSLWDAAGVRRAPSAVVAVRDGAALRAAQRALASNSGTVWSADSRDGIHGGAHGVRPVEDPSAIDAAIAFFAPRSDHVRVMPYLDGVPCSVHALVLPDATAVFRPVEMLVLRRREGGFLYAGCATTWDPPSGVRDEMRYAARRTGDYLRRHRGYAGAFTLDGVATAEGFLPTELNARPGAGLNCLAASMPELPVHGLCWAAAEGVSNLRGTAESLEEALVHAADAKRSGWASAVLGERRSESVKISVVHEGEQFREAREGENASGTLEWGPSPAGSFLKFQPVADLLVPGRSFAPVAAAALAAGRRLMGAPVPELEE